MRHTDLVNTIESLVDATCADSVKDALAAVCAKQSSACMPDDEDNARLWFDLATQLNAIRNLGV